MATAADEDDLLDDDEPLVEEGETPEEAPSIEDTVEDLRRQIAEEKRLRLEEKRLRVAAESKAVAATAEVDDTNLQLVESAMDTVARDVADLKAQMAEALRVGDHAGAVEINQELQIKGTQLQQLEHGRDRMKDAAQKPKLVQQNRAPTVDEFASTLSPRSADWVRAHAEYVTNPALNARMVAAHNFAVANGIVPDTDEYFEQVETMLKIRKPAEVPQESTGGATLAAPRRPVPPPAAPAGGGNGGGKGSVRLTAAERQTARDLDMTDEEYAEGKATAIKTGRMQSK